MKILCVDDDRDLVDLLSYVFQRDGFAVSAAYDGEAALALAQREKIDIILLDLNLPKLHGMQVLRELRRDPNVTIIVLTALGDEDHLVTALNLGADDYLVKPFRPRELRARVQATLRRSRLDAPTLTTSRGPLQCGEIALDPQRREVTVAGHPVQLTYHEFALLHYLMLNRDIVVPVPDIIANVWGFDAEGEDSMIRTTMSRLRRKVEADPAHPRYLTNRRGQGYLFQVRQP
jgi:two-component system, OmpR family, response regulator VicR